MQVTLCTDHCDSVHNHLVAPSALLTPFKKGVPTTLYTIHIDEIEEGTTENIEIWVAGHRRITISINKHNMSVQMPTTFNAAKVNIRPGAFFMRTEDFG